MDPEKRFKPKISKDNLFLKKVINSRHQGELSKANTCSLLDLWSLAGSKGSNSLKKTSIVSRALAQEGNKASKAENQAVGDTPVADPRDFIGPVILGKYSDGTIPSVEEFARAAAKRLTVKSTSLKVKRSLPRMSDTNGNSDEKNPQTVSTDNLLNDPLKSNKEQAQDEAVEQVKEEDRAKTTETRKPKKHDKDKIKPKKTDGKSKGLEEFPVVSVEDRVLQASLHRLVSPMERLEPEPVLIAELLDTLAHKSPPDLVSSPADVLILRTLQELQGYIATLGHVVKAAYEGVQLLNFQVDDLVANQKAIIRDLTGVTSYVNNTIRNETPIQQELEHVKGAVSSQTTAINNMANKLEKLEKTTDSLISTMEDVESVSSRQSMPRLAIPKVSRAEQERRQPPQDEQKDEEGSESSSDSELCEEDDEPEEPTFKDSIDSDDFESILDLVSEGSYAKAKMRVTGKAPWLLSALIDAVAHHRKTNDISAVEKYLSEATQKYKPKFKSAEKARDTKGAKSKRREQDLCFESTDEPQRGVLRVSTRRDAPPRRGLPQIGKLDSSVRKRH